MIYAPKKATFEMAGSNPLTGCPLKPFFEIIFKTCTNPQISGPTTGGRIKHRATPYQQTDRIWSQCPFLLRDYGPTHMTIRFDQHMSEEFLVTPFENPSFIYISSQAP